MTSEANRALAFIRAWYVDTEMARRVHTSPRPLRRQALEWQHPTGLQELVERGLARLERRSRLSGEYVFLK